MALPPERRAPNFRKAMVEDAGLPATFPDADTAVIEPRDQPTSLLDAHRLASRGESRERMWRVLGEHPRRDQESRHASRAIDEVNRLASLETREGMLSAFALLLLVTSNRQLRAELDPHEA